uniref:Uncharacterized protein n=1 Tax=Candidatus Kentrum sp. LFY TaxID=2126342 RepID=A0A450UAE5_9GAMM|nr:MAG: hypothetical protein BECKLFY1418B_GA0070995_101342 [Candidatus Kentron sp. LFY]VFJ91934.1 MAG: hypothetical protein BECKLFY1418A_GA0070994_101928 [Candidatus Kentron sp. LFY]
MPGWDILFVSCSVLQMSQVLQNSNLALSMLNHALSVRAQASLGNSFKLGIEGFQETSIRIREMKRFFIILLPETA